MTDYCLNVLANQAIKRDSHFRNATKLNNTRYVRAVGIRSEDTEPSEQKCLLSSDSACVRAKGIEKNQLLEIQFC